MIEPIKTPGSPSANAKFKSLADSANTSSSFRGDNIFIFATKGPGYWTVRLDIQAVIARVPRSPGNGVSGNNDAGQYQGEVRGNVTDGQMGNGPIILVDIP